jgi:hypothetical protein
MNYKYIVKPTVEKYKKFVKKLRDIYIYDIQAHLDEDVNPYYYDKNLQNEKLDECVKDIIDGLGYRGTFEDILVETLGRNNAKKEIRDADGYDSIALYNVIMECITTKEVKATKEDKNKAVSTLQAVLRRKLSKKPEPPKKEPSKSYGLLQNTGASMLQAVLRRTLTKKPEPEKKKPEPEKKKAGRPKKNDMTEEEKRLERNRKARERYAMKKGQK